MKKTVVLLSFLFGVWTCTFLLAAPTFRVFLFGKPVDLHPVVLQNAIYLPLTEVTTLFHVKADVDLPRRTILLEKEEEAESTADHPASSDVPNAVILGKIETTLNHAVEKPFLNVKVSLFKANEHYSEDVNRKALNLWIFKNNPFYADTHGKVAETASDSEGRFAFAKIPPGNYELVAVHPLSSRETGFWWVPIQVRKGETQEISFDSENLQRVRLK